MNRPNPNEAVHPIIYNLKLCEHFNHPPLNSPLQLYHLIGDIPAELAVMLHEQDGRGVGEQQFFDLHAGDDVDEVERFVPDMQVDGLAEALRDQDLLLLAAAEGGNILLELQAREVELAQDRFEQALVDAAALGVIRQAALQVRGILGDVGDAQLAADAKRAGVRDVLAADQLQQAGFTGAVRPG